MRVSSSMRAVLLVSLLGKLGLAWWFADLEPHYDERQFLRQAQALAGGAGFESFFRAPGYTLFMAAGLWLGGGHVIGVRILQVLLSTATAFLAYRIGRSEWGERAGFWAGLLVAFYPSQIAFSHWLWAETLYTALILLAFERLLALDRSGGRSTAVVAGLSLAAASLVRSTGLGLLVLSVGWLAWRWRQGTGKASLRLIGLLLAVAIGVVASWSIPASQRADCLVVVDLNGPFNLWSGNAAEIPEGLPGLFGVGLPLDVPLDSRVSEFRPFDAWRAELPGRLAAAGVEERFGCDGAAWFRDQALSDIAKAPGAFLARIPVKLAAFWSPDFFVARHLLRGWYGEGPGGVALLLVLLTLAAACIPLIAGPVGLVAAPPSHFRSLALFWIGLYLAVHALTFGVSRMHFPLVPLLLLAVVGASEALRGGRAGEIRRRALRRGLPLGVGIAVAWALIAPLVIGLYVAPAPQQAALLRSVAGLRHWPTPGSEFLAWHLASVEASLGNEARAREVLDEPGIRERGFSRYLRARLSPLPDRGEDELRQLVAAEGDGGGVPRFAALVSLARLELERGDLDAGLRSLRAAQSMRPDDGGITAAIQEVEAARASAKPAIGAP